MDKGLQWWDEEGPSDDELESLEREMASGKISEEGRTAKAPKVVKTMENDKEADEFGIKSLTKRPRKDNAAVAQSHRDWVMGVPNPEHPEDSDHDTYPWPKPFVNASMKAQRGFEARENVQNHIINQGLVKDDGGVPMVTLRRIGKPSAGVTNASYLPDWGQSQNKEGKYSTGGYGRPAQEDPETAGTWEWEVPLHHVIGHGMASEGEVFAVHHPSIQPRRVAGP